MKKGHFVVRTEKPFTLPTVKPFEETSMAVRRKYMSVKTAVGVLMPSSVKRQRKTVQYD